MPKLFPGFKDEWKHLFSNRLLLISSIVMFIIPILYGGFFLGSIWDPYGKTQNLPVAVVNEDKPAEVQGKQISVGNDIVNNLKENHSLKWEFVSKDQAQKGLNDGYYYMVITMPENFSKNAASITSNTPQESKLLYTVTPSKNYIGSLISNQAAEKVVENVKQTLTKSYATAMLASLDKLKDGMSQAADGANQLASGTSQLSDGITTYTSGVSQIATNQQTLTNGLSQLSSGSSQLADGLNQMSNQLPTPTQISQLTSGISSVQSGLNQLNSAVTNPDPTLVALQTKVAADGNTVKADAATIAPLLPSLQALAAAGSATPINVPITSAQAGSVLKFAGDVQTLGNDLASLNTALSTQQKALQTNVAALSAGMNQLAPNATTAINGYNTVRTGASQLSAGANQLNSGLSTAYNGSTQLTNGANQLAANSPKLLDGATQLNTGASTLATKLGDASKQLSLQPTGDATASQISKPVAGEKSEKGDVPNYGFALAPYVLALGLYVGTLVFSVIYPVRKMFGKPRTAFEWFLGKWTVSSVIALGQVLVLGGVMTLVLGLKPVDPVGFFAMLLVTAWAFMGIVVLLAIALDNPGRFFAMLLLVLQLGGAEGTFPLGTAPDFFRTINNWLPMTYTIRGLRQTISGDVGGVSLAHNVWIVFLFGLVANIILYIFLFVHKTKPFRHASIDGD